MRAARARSLRNPSMTPRRGKNRKRVFGPQDAAGVERDQHERPHLEAPRQRVRDRKPLQRQRRPEPAGDDREILRGGSGQGVGAAKADEEQDPERPGQRKRRRQVGPGPRKIVRELGRAGRGVEVDAQHQERRGGDRGGTEPHQRVGEVARRETARRAVERVGGEDGERVRDVARALAVAAIEDDHRRQRRGGAEHSEQRRQRDNGADRRMGGTVRLQPAEVSGERRRPRTRPGPRRERRPTPRTPARTTARRPRRARRPKSPPAIAPASSPQPRVAIMIGSGAR